MEKTLTVVQTLPALHSGGVERGTLEIARALVAAGHRSIVISSGGRLVEQLLREGSEHITLPVHRKSLFSLLQVRPFRRILDDIRPDIVHARSRIPAWITWLALRGMNPATRPHFVTTVHGLYSVSPYSAIMASGERVIAVSETVRQYILQHYRTCRPDNIKLIYRGVDPSEFPYGYQPTAEWRQQWQARFPQLANKKVLTLPGRITRLKGHEAFISLIGQLKAEGLAVHGVIVGGAEEKKQDYLAELHQLVARHNLADDITFTGLRNDIRDIFAVSDLVFSLSSKPESFGRTVLEALRLGRPVIAWDKGGAGEILARLWPEGLIPDQDTDRLGSQARQLLLGTRQVPESNSFLLETMCRETLAVYEDLASLPGKSS